MISFMKWLYEDNGAVAGTYQNDELLQSRVNSKYLAVVNKKDMVDKTAECLFAGMCEKKPKKKFTYMRVAEEL